MNSVLFGNGYWGNIVKEKIKDLTNLLLVADSKTDDKIIAENLIQSDIVFICSSTVSHYEIVKRCIEQNIKYIFCTKPFTGDYNEASKLFELAKQQDVNIFVDNLFLFRKEILDIQLKRIRDINFIWTKSIMNHRENILNSLLYHDLYLLLKWSRYSDKWGITFIKMGKNTLYLTMTNDYQTCSFDYSIDKIGGKFILINGHAINLTFPKNDPLKECIVNMIQDNIDYDSCRNVTLDTLKLLSFIKEKL